MVEKYLAELDARKVRSNTSQFGPDKAGARLSNDRGDDIVILLDSAGYYTFMVNGENKLTGKAGN